MEFYDIVNEYVKYDRIDKNNKADYELQEMRKKREYYEKKIKEEVVGFRIVTAYPEF